MEDFQLALIGMIALWVHGAWSVYIFMSNYTVTRTIIYLLLITINIFSVWVIAANIMVAAGY